MANREMKGAETAVEIRIHPLTPKRWNDFETLFGANGACGGCWCMSWRLLRKEFDSGKGESNRRAMKKLVESGTVPGLLAYHKSKPIAWCSVAPRDQFPRLDKAPTLRRIDDEPVWSITCFFIDKRYRRFGISTQLIEAAKAFVKKKGGRIVEGYPYTVKKGAVPLPGAFVWTGLWPSFKRAGFVIASRRSNNRPIVRFYLD